MSVWQRLESILATDERDPGCAEVFDRVHEYAQLLADGRDAETAMPDLAAHLSICGPCAEDLRGLLAVLEAEAGLARGDDLPPRPE